MKKLMIVAAIGAAAVALGLTQRGSHIAIETQPDKPTHNADLSLDRHITELTPPSLQASVPALPRSFAGTEIDGHFEVDSRGNLVITADIRHIFDYFLSAYGEDSLEHSIERLENYVRSQLQEPAQSQALQILSQYLQYKYELLGLNEQLGATTGLDSLRLRERSLRELRARILSPEVHRVFFADEEAFNHFTLERIALRQDPTLSDQQKAQVLDQLRAALPEHLQQALAPQLQTELRQQTAALQAQGGTAEQIRQLRLQMVGAEATERLHVLDQQRAHWQQRLDDYQQAKTTIEANRGLSPEDRQQALQDLIDERFDERERLRLSGIEEVSQRTSR